jgi:hypothetical protein
LKDSLSCRDNIILIARGSNKVFFKEPHRGSITIAPGFSPGDQIKDFLKPL